MQDDIEIQTTVNTMQDWSFSRLKSFEECPLRVKYRYIDKIKEPPLPDDSPAVRGTKIHDAAELFVRGELDELPIELARHYEDEFKELRTKFLAGQVEMEVEEGVTKDWEYIGEWGPETWLKLKIDSATYMPEEKLGFVVDVKTGKSKYSGVKHAQQIQLYQLVFFLKHPECENIIAELWYVDEGYTRQFKFTRAQGLRFQKNFDKRAKKMLEDQAFTPRPSTWNCRFCAYGKKKGGLDICPFAVEV